MSYSTANANFQIPVVTAAHEDVPQSCLSSGALQPIQSVVKLKQVYSQNAAPGPSSLMVFPLSCQQGAGFLKSGSVYLQGLLVVDQADGGRALFNHAGGAEALIYRLQVTLNGTIAETCLNYNRWSTKLDLHCSQQGYVQNDLAVMTQRGQLQTAAAAQGLDGFGWRIPFVIPIKSAVLNASQDLPLFMFQNAQIELQTDTIASSFYSGGGQAVTNYQIQTPKLIYETFNPDVNFENSMRQVLMSGKLFQIPVNTWYNNSQSNAGSVKSIVVGLKAQSIMGVMYNAETDGAGSVAATNQHFATGDTPSGQGLRVFVDGVLQNNYSIVDTPTIFAERSRLLGILADPERSAAQLTAYINAGAVQATQASGSLTTTPLTPAIFLANQFLGGLSLQKVSEAGFVMCGTSCNQQLLIEVTNAGSDGTLYYFIPYQSIVCIDGQGMVQVLK